MRAILRRAFIVLTAYTKESESIQVNNLLVYFTAVEKQEQTKPKTVDRERYQGRKWQNVNRGEKVQRINEWRVRSLKR